MDWVRGPAKYNKKNYLHTREQMHTKYGTSYMNSGSIISADHGSGFDQPFPVSSPQTQRFTAWTGKKLHIRCMRVILLYSAASSPCTC